MTGLVYGVVALIVKADDAGLWLVKRPRASSNAISLSFAANAFTDYRPSISTPFS
jgi:predicted DNA repair protein MutK